MKISELCNGESGIPKVIPPGSVFRLSRFDENTPGWKDDVGRVFRIGYYSKEDGLDVIWLVNENGKYEQTTDRDYLLSYFELVTISTEQDLYGEGKAQFPPI